MSTPGTASARGRLLRDGLLALTLSGFALAMTAPAATAVATGPTVVTLTFDDSLASLVPAAQQLKSVGLHGTFYTVDQWVGAPGYLSQADLQTIAANGNEIGGHSVTHPDLTAVSAAEATRQICDDRATLQAWGFQPVDFAYPYASSNAQVEAAAASCGYHTSRGLGDVRSSTGCPTCAYAAPMVPPDPQWLAAPEQVDGRWTLAQMKAQVTQAVNHGGGWVILTFHAVCAPIGAGACDASYSTTPTIFNAFTSWLANYAAQPLNRTSVKTVDQQRRATLGASYPAYVPAVAAPSPPPAPMGVNAVGNPSLETQDAATGLPACFQLGGWGANTPLWAPASPGQTGTYAEQLQMGAYVNGDAKMLPTLDLGQCTPSVTAGRSYTIGAWYQATGITQFALYYRTSANTWFYWTSGPWLAPSATWTQASFVTPPVPDGVTGVTFGLAAIANGTLVTDDYSFVDPGPVVSSGSLASRLSPLPGPSLTSPSSPSAARAGPLPHRLRPGRFAQPLLPGSGGGAPVRVATPELGKAGLG